MKLPAQNFMPFFSIVIPQYNRSSFLLKCLETIVAQNFKNFEICISDDCSTDGRQNEIYDFLVASGVSFRFEQTPRNLRYDGNLRNAISLSSGRYLFFMGNDDGLADLDVLQRTADKLIEQNFPAVLISNWFEGPGGVKTSRVRTTRHLGSGPAVALQVWREYSFVSGIVMDGNRCRQLAQSLWDGSEMYQMWLGSRIVAEGGGYYAWDEPLIIKDVPALGEIVDSYRDKKKVPWFKERLHTLHYLARLNFHAIASEMDESAKPKLAEQLVNMLYSTTYPFWLFEYRQTQSWNFALAIGLGMRPRHVMKDLPLSGFARMHMQMKWLYMTVAGLIIPIFIFNSVKPFLHSLVKRKRMRVN